MSQPSPSTPRPFPGSCRVYKQGSTYVAETWNGKLITSTTSGADVAINAAVCNIPAAVSGGFGGRVFIQAGDYTCVSGITASSEISGRYHGVSIVGEGPGTRLIFAPLSGQTLANGIEFRMQYPQLKDMMLWASTSGVRTLVYAAGPTTVRQFNWGVVENVSFNGKDSTIPLGEHGTIHVSGLPVSGQIGLLIDGSHFSGGSYFAANWKVHNSEFFALDRGVKVKGLFADMCNHSNIHCGACTVGYEIQGVQHNLSNFRIEGGGGSQANQVGTIGVWMRESEVSGHNDGGTISLLSNINVELHKSDSVGLLMDRGGPANNRIVNLFNSSADEMTKFVYIDNRTDVAANYVNDSQFLGLTPESRFRQGWINFGLNRAGNEHGLLEGNIKRQVSGADTVFTTTPFISGPFMSLTTAAASGSVACVFYDNGSGTSSIRTEQYPSMSVRFIPNSTTAIRIFMGLANKYTAPTSPLSTMISGVGGIGFYLDTDVSNNWKITNSISGGAQNIADFPTFTWGDTTYGPNAISAGLVQTTTIAYNNDNPSASVRHHGLAFDYKTSGVIPTVNTSLGFMIAIENISGSTAKTLRLFDETVTVKTI